MISIAHFLKRTYRAGIDALFPVKCLVCECFFEPSDNSPWRSEPDHVPDRRDHHHGGIDCFKIPFVCSGCAEQINFVKGPICLSCGIMFKSSQGDDRLCGDCITVPKRFRIARAPMVYDQAMVQLIHCFKYNAKIQLTKAFSGLLLTALNRYWEANSVDLVLPVPLSGSKLRQRGFNQAYLLVRSWKTIADQFNMPPPGVSTSKNALVRTRATIPQTGLGRKARLQNIKNAFSVRDGAAIRDMRILLVDDVYTTGATVNECARELMDDGARCVDVLTLARAM
jgi:ComF family protein